MIGKEGWKMERELYALIDRGEGEQVEFKTASKGVHDDTFETVCSFGNHLGGDILLGVNDHGRVVGLPRRLVGEVSEHIRKRCACLDVFSSAMNISVAVEQLFRRKIVRIHVSPSLGEVSYKGVRYVRSGECDYKAR